MLSHMTTVPIVDLTDTPALQRSLRAIKIRQSIQLVLLVICTAILVVFLVRAIQIQNALSHIGDEVGQVGGDTSTSQTCTFEQADQQGRCPDDPDYGTGAS